MDRINHFYAAILTICGAAGAAQAQSAWEFEVTPYAWMAGLDGDLGTIPGFPSSKVELSFGDILDDLDMAAMLFASARRGPWVFLFDSTYVKTSSTEDVSGLLIDDVKVKSRTTTLALGAGRTVAEGPHGTLDAYFGIRAWWLENDFTVRTPLGNRDRSEDENWVDPILGLAGRYQASERWTLFGSAEIGGFGMGADSEWALIGGASYAVTDRFGVTVAWRHQAVDYDEDGVVYDVVQSGPLLGATFRF